MQTLIPIALTHLGRTLTLAEVVHRLAGSRKRVHTVRVDPTPDGDFELKWLDNGEWTSAEDYEAKGRESAERYGRAAEAVLIALRHGDLQAYMGLAANGVCYQLPWSYWINKDHVADDVIGSEGWDGTGDKAGEPIMVSELDFDRWRATLPAAPAPSEQGGDTRRRPPLSSVRQWVKKRVRAGDSKAAVETARVDAFPDHLPPGRTTVRTIYDEELYAHEKRAPQRGRPAND